ncbi:hypothetical protein ACFVFT_38040 [Streptomyces tendae]|uniref:hypothetical protein n=1 Tax=Streptomyces tendae TaxID=1932 RepID=UPI0036C6E54F
MSSFNLDEQETSRRFASYFKELEDRIASLERANPLTHASLEGGSIDVYDDDGSLQTVIGEQADGTTGVVHVNGPPPPTPTVPLLAPVINGVAATWDGLFADADTAPLDFSRVEVHADPAADFEPSPLTLVSTIESPRGGIFAIPTDTPVYVRFLARNLSGTGSEPSTTAGPESPAKVVADDVLDGIITETKLAEDAVTEAKIALGAVGNTALADGAVLAEKLAKAAVTLGKIADGAVNGPALAADSVTAGKVAADAIGTRELQAESVTALEIAAGSVTAEKMTIVGSTNVLPDPSFDGAGGAAIASKSQFVTQDKTFGNGSAASLKIDVVTGTGSFRSAELTLLPVTPGDQVYLAVDYYVSADWAGSEISFHARWEKADGTILSYGKLTALTPVRGAWTRLSGTVTAPAGATHGRIRAESARSPAGAVWFDNGAVRPVVAGVQIADGAITTPKLVANAITVDKLAALSVTAEKIAALAVTAEKLAALSVTTDKLAANAVTATKILAGSVDATHIKAGAINADKLMVGTSGDNLIPDPSFEGAVSQVRVEGITTWNIVDGGNGTPKALQVTAANATPLTRALDLVVLPATPGQKMFLAVDYFASADWVGERVMIAVNWLTADGTWLAQAPVATTAGATALGSWQRLVGLGTPEAPANTTKAAVRVYTANSTAGTVLFDNAQAMFVTASGVAGARAEMSPLGLQLYNDDGEEAVALMTGRPNYLSLRTDGVPVATIDQEGGAGFQRLAVAESLSIAGTDLSEYLATLPRGIQAVDYQVSTRTASGSEMGFVELACDIDPTRMYRFRFVARANPSVAGGELQIRLRDGGSGSPTINSKQLMLAVHPMPLETSFTADLEHIQNGASLGGGNHRFLIGFSNLYGPSGQTCTMSGEEGALGYFYIEDAGPHVVETGGYNDGGGTTAPTPQKYTKYYNASWSGTYSRRSSYNSFYGNTCMQGYYSSTNGTMASLIGFPSSLGSDLSGAVIIKAEVYLYFDHWYANAGGKAVIKAHSHSSRPSSFSSDSEAKTVNWARNEGKWVDITSVFDSSKWRGIALDPNSTSSTYYGRARGYGQTNPPRLKVTYTK